MDLLVGFSSAAVNVAHQESLKMLELHLGCNQPVYDLLITPHHPAGLTLGDDGQLRGKPLHMAGLLLEEGEGDEAGEVGVLMASLLEATVQVTLQRLPQGVTPGAYDHGPPHGAIVCQLRLLYYIQVPPAKCLLFNDYLVVLSSHLKTPEWALKL